MSPLSPLSCSLCSTFQTNPGVIAANKLWALQHSSHVYHVLMIQRATDSQWLSDHTKPVNITQTSFHGVTTGTISHGWATALRRGYFLPSFSVMDCFLTEISFSFNTVILICKALTVQLKSSTIRKIRNDGSC